ncbi:MAG: hypothetical protein AAGF20_04430 [Pseudomonadota bacterium]
MTVTWPENTKAGFGRDTLMAQHDIHTNSIFSDDGLAALLDEYPREELGIWTFGAHCEGEAPAIKGAAPDASGAEIMEAVRKGTIWLNLRRANCAIERLQPIADDIFGSLTEASGRKLRKQDMGLLISSPKVHVHYHLDIPIVALFQIRGRKRLWLYPADEEHAPSDHIEGIVHMLKEEGLPFRESFDRDAMIVDLEPGMGLTWPQTAPHRVQNEDCVNVSLSCEYMTLPALINANAIYMNGVLRRQYGMSPKRPASMTPASFGKAAMAQAVKRLRGHTPLKSPTPITFTLDKAAENGVRAL